MSSVLHRFLLSTLMASLLLGGGSRAVMARGHDDTMPSNKRASAHRNDPASWVDPFIGTGGHGHTYPGATLPFGMVQLSPDTRLEGWDGCSGYHDDDRVIYGFSHTHLSGTGVSDYGDILFMPITGDIRLDNGFPDHPETGYASRFSKASESAAPGWYRVVLDDDGIDVQLTATERTGLHRYTFPPGRPTHVIVDLTHRDEVIDSWIRIVSEQEIEGLRRSSGWAKNQWVYFVARFSKPFVRAGLANNGSLLSDVRFLKSTQLKAAFSFGDEGGPLLVKVGISAVDTKGARRNLQEEQPGWDFDDVKDRARRQWNEALGRIRIEGASDSQRTIFTTALYHSLLAPNIFSDADGRYRGMDGEIHQAEERRQYTVFSLWDTFRATHPLFTLLEPRREAEFVNTFLAQYEQGGSLPVWELAANETNCMIGYHSVSVIADAYLKGIRGFDAREALSAMVHSANSPGSGLQAYRTMGFIPSGIESESVSKTLEYAYDDWCIARMAQAMDEDSLATRFYERSQAWRHLLDPTSLFFRARENQRWLTPFDPRRVDFNYTEANAWQYRFFVPHDVEALMQAMGGEEHFVAALDSLFSTSSRTTGREQADITGLIGQYAHGNEPSHHIAWLYHYAGLPQRSGEMVHHILQQMYRAEPDGLSGNEDCGQMSSWYVLSALGLYQPAPASNEWLLGTPLFDRTVINLGNGKSLTIQLAAKEHPMDRRWQGKPLPRSWLSHHELMEGGRLELPRLPSSGSTTEKQARPRSRVPGRRVIAAPYLVASADRFRDSLKVELRCFVPSARLYAVEKEIPGPVVKSSSATGVNWKEVTGPLVLEKTTKLSFRAKVADRSSPTVQASFFRIPHDWTIHVEGDPNSQYTAGGPDALIDGRRGTVEWRTGLWQGYQGMDFQATVDLRRVEEVHRAGAGFLQDMRSWIWFPVEIIVSTSLDGVHFTQLARIENQEAKRDDTVSLRDFVTGFPPTKARFLRIEARNSGIIPAWHPGHGGETFLFIDEILVD